jgi:hypothetical protein
MAAASAGAGLVLMTGLAVGAAGAANPDSSVPVRFVLEPSWLPGGYSASGGGWVTPAGGLHVFPNSGANAMTVSVGRDGQQSTPVLFALSYYGFHNPESKSIRLLAFNESSPLRIPNTVRLNGRTVALTSYTEGAFHNVVTTAQWDEHGDAIALTTEGLTTDQTSRFIKGLVEHRPPTG